MGKGLTAEKIERLKNSVRRSREKMGPYREKRLDAIREYVGAHYSDDGANDKNPVNLLELAVNVYSRQLAARAPKVLVSTPYRQLRPFASDFEEGLNYLVDKIRFEDTIRRVVIEAMFGVGVVKVGLNQSETVEIGGTTHDVGQPYADVIDLDDFVIDMRAKRIEEAAYIGNRYRLAREDMEACGLFDAKQVRKVASLDNPAHNEDGSERAVNVGASQEYRDDDFIEYVELIDLWLPRERKLVTIDSDSGSEAGLLREIDWEGPENGPYHILYFSEVPGNLMPLPPRALWMDLHTLANSLFRKLGRQAERQKTILGVSAEARDDGERIVDANDGDAITVLNPEKAREYRFGGIDEPGLAFLLQVKDMFSWFAGNLDAMGGLGPQADTATQERIVAEASSKRMADMQDRLIRFVKGVLRDIAWYCFYDPMIELPYTKRLPQFDSISVSGVLTAKDFEGEFLQYNFNIEPYSMQHQSPAQKVQTMTQVLQIIAPMIPMLQQQGKDLDWGKLFEFYAKYANIPELNEMIMTATGIPDNVERGPVGQAPAKPAHTTRTYERVNRPGATRQGKEAALTQTLLGGRSQRAEMAAIGRPVG